jgi:hypothetical protein
LPRSRVSPTWPHLRIKLAAGFNGDVSAVTGDLVGKASVFRTGTPSSTPVWAIFGDIGQATDLFTTIHNVAENALTGPIYALNTLLQGWSNLGGRTVLIQAFGKAFQDLGAVLKPIRDAFKEIFPPTTALEIYNITYRFSSLMDKFKIGAQTSEDLRRIFAGIFAVAKLGFDVIEQLGKTFAHLFGLAFQGSGTFLDFAARIGDWLVKVTAAIERGDDLTRFFDRLRTVLSVPILMVQAFAQYIGELFDKFDPGKAEKALDAVSTRLGPIGKLGQLANEAWGVLFKHLGDVATVIDPLAEKFVNFFGSVGHALVSGLGNINFSQVLGVVNTGLFGGLILLIKKFVDKMKDKGEGGGLTGFADSIKETFEGLTKTLETMQGTLKAATLLEIAAAVGLLTISAVALSKIDAGGLARSSAALTAMFTQLVASMAIFQKFVGTEDFAKMPIMMGSLILLALAIDILTSAVKKLAAFGLGWGAQGHSRSFDHTHRSCRRRETDGQSGENDIHWSGPHRSRQGR